MTESLDDQVELASRNVSTDEFSMSIGEVVNLYRDGDLIINPNFQRLFRCGIERKSRFIESILVRIPIPPIFVFEVGDGKWKIIDGLQRLSTILEFMGELMDPKTGDKAMPTLLVGTPYLPDNSRTFTAAGVSGYFDYCAATYVRFIEANGLKIEDLKVNFWALILRQRYPPSYINNDEKYFAFVQECLNIPKSTFRRFSKFKITGKSNLHSTVLETCAMMLSVDIGPLKPYFDFIDTKLCDERNAVAHGNYLKINLNDFVAHRDKTLEILGILANQFENATGSRSYMR